MKRIGFHYNVEATLTFTGKDLWMLFESSRGHYDAKCRSVSHPAKNNHGGELWGLLNRFEWENEEISIKNSDLPKETSQEDVFRWNCTNYPTATITCDLPFRTLDTFAKCIEFTPSEPDLSKLRLAIRDAVFAIKAESLRLNPEPTASPEEVR